jgi:hypothetical protein
VMLNRVPVELPFGTGEIDCCYGEIVCCNGHVLCAEVQVNVS